MTNGLIIAAEPALRLPPVVIEFIEDDEQQIRLARSSQTWWKAGAEPHTTEIWLPVIDGADGIDVLMPDGTARRYIIKFMNMKAKRMLAAGYRPRLKTQIEDALIGFSQKIDATGRVQ